MSGLPAIDPDVRRQAIDWFVRLSSGSATHEDHGACDLWRRQHPDHERAWARLAALRNALGQVPTQIATPALKAAALSRRSLLRGMSSLVIVGGASALALHEQAWRPYVADQRTAVGERRELMLADGSTLILGSNSAVDIDFDARERRLRLHRGEILLETGHLPGEQRPLLVQTPEGSVRALGTRFSLRRYAEQTQVAVLSHAVEVRPADSGTVLRLEAGQQLVFKRDAAEAPSPLPAGSDAWIHGQLIVSDRPLGHVVADLARYRRGVLRCAPAVAGIRVSGVLPLDDTDRALAILAGRFPIRVSSASRYWVTVDAPP